MNKAVAIARQHNVDYILEHKHTVTKALPLAVVLTLPATGSESNANSVITKAETQNQRALSALIHPNV